MIKKEMIAMLLAGGQGSRLGVLTSKVAKPAVAFGGKYRIIDFPLSNCINSGVDTVGVLTQYQPLRLNTHIGIGIPWDLDRNIGGVTVLPPYEKSTNSEWYTGTANAIYQNIDYMESFNPEYILILSGDHIYKMNYTDMLEYHKKKGADCTIAVIDVPIEEASRFGIMSAYDDGKIYKFTEKPAKPDSTKASMGIYVFTKDKLQEYLAADAANPESSNDFGKNIIPNMLGAGEKMMAYPFEGYWKDVGTIQSLWEANMDLLGERPTLSMLDESWRIYSRHGAESPQFVGKDAKVINSSVTAGCEILGTVKNCVLGSGVTVEEGAVVEDSVIFENVRIGRGAKVSYAILDANVRVGANATVGESRESGKEIAVLGADVTVADGETVPAGAMISEM